MLFPAPRVVGGQGSPRLAPCMAAVFSNGLCSGFLVDDRWVITAAHCQANATHWFVIVGAEDLNSGTVFGNESVINQPVFDPYTFENEITIIKLADFAPGGSAFATVNCDENLPVDSEYVKAGGFGAIPEGQPITEVDFVLKSVYVPVVPTSVCRSLYTPPIITYDTI